MAVVLLTGATGFVGRHVSQAIAAQGHELIAVGRSAERLAACPWLSDARTVEADVFAGHFDRLGMQHPPDWLVHLAWNPLRDSSSLQHFDVGLAGSWRFIRSCVEAGVKNVLVSGTCLEYGLSEGVQHAGKVPDPVTAYGSAKDALRRYLQCLQALRGFNLVWARIFYMYGEGQSEYSLLPTLDRAVRERWSRFPMSPGDQLRDFIPAPMAASQLASLLNGQPARLTLANICSGTPVSVRAFVEAYLRGQPWAPQLDLGAMPYSGHEPRSFWGESGVVKV